MLSGTPAGLPPDGVINATKPNGTLTMDPSRLHFCQRLGCEINVVHLSVFPDYVIVYYLYDLVVDGLLDE